MVNPCVKIKQETVVSSIYLTLNINTNRSIFFWFSNGVFQEIFKDTTEMILDEDKITYIDK